MIRICSTRLQPIYRIIFAVLLAVLLSGLAIGAPFDRGWITERVLDKLSDVLGRRIEVVGELDIDISWTPSLRAEQVRIANAAWSDEPYMAKFGSIEASIDLGRLLKGQLVFPKLTVLEPQVLLEVSAQHQANWNLAAADLPQAQQIAEQTLDLALQEIEKSGEPPPDQADPAIPEDLTLPLIQQLRVETGSLRYLNHTNGVKLDASLDSAKGHMNNQEIALEVKATLEQRPLTLTIQGGSVQTLAKPMVTYPLALAIKAEDFSIGLTGDLQNPLELGGGELALSIEGSGMPALVNAWFGAELPQLPDYRLQAILIHEELSRWQLQDLDSHFGVSDLAGSLAVDLATAPPEINIELHSKTLNIAQLNAIAAGFESVQEQPEQALVIDVSVLRQWQGDVDLSVGELILPGDTSVDQVIAKGQLAEGQLDLETLQFKVAEGAVNGQLRLDAGIEPNNSINGTAQLELVNIDWNQLSGQPSDTEPLLLNGSVSLRLAETATDAGRVGVASILAQLRLENSELHYQDPEQGTDLQLSAALTGAEHNLQLQAQGRWQNQLVMVDIKGGPLSELRDANTPYAISGETAVGELKGNIEAKILYNDTLWTLQDFTFGFGNSQLRGEAELDLASDKPFLRGDFEASSLDLNELNELMPSGKSDPQATAPEAADLSALQNFDTELKLQIEHLQLTPELELTEAGIDLALKDGQLAINSLQAKWQDQLVSLSGELNIAGPVSGQFIIDLGKLNLAALGAAYGVEGATGTLMGSVTVTIVGGTPSKKSTLALPGLGRIKIEPSELRYINSELGIDITALISSRISEQNTQEIVIKANGSYREEVFALNVHGDSPLVLLDPDLAYGLNAELTLLETTIKVSGQLAQPISLNKLDLALAISGPDPAVLKPLLNIPLPELPPYSLKGQLKRAGGQIEFNDFTGKVGDSDIGGDLLLKLDTTPISLYATMSSNKIDLDDLAGLIGGTPAADPGETASKEQRQKQIRQQQSPFLLPQEPLNLEQASQFFNGVIKFKGKRLQTSKLPFDELAFTLKLDQRQVSLEPLTFGIGEGRVESTINLDVRQQVAEGNIDTKIYRVNLKQLLAPFEIADDSLGLIGGQMKLWVQGDSLAQWFASADGGLFLLMTDGKLDVLLTELAGLDIGEALVALAGEVESIPIDCAYIDAHTENGILELTTTVIDTSDTLFLADGFVDFNQELIGVTIEPRPKDVSLFSLRSPLYIEGRLKEPSVYPGASGIIVRGAAAVLLGAAATPLAALLPFIEPPSGEDSVYCKGLVETLEKAR